jgi:hypothetical protein
MVGRSARGGVRPCRSGSIAAALVLSLLAGTGAQSRPPNQRKSLYVYVGYGTLALGDVNRDIKCHERAVQSQGFPASYDTFGGAVDLGLGLSYRVGKVTSLGIDFGYQDASVRNGYSGLSWHESETVDLRIIDIDGVLVFRLPTALGFHLGASAGLGLGRARHEYRHEDPTNYTSRSARKFEYTGSGITTGTFAGFMVPFGTVDLFLLRVGCRFSNRGKFHGPEGWAEGCDDGRAIDFDFSGAYVRAALGIYLR